MKIGDMKRVQELLKRRELLQDLKSKASYDAGTDATWELVRNRYSDGENEGCVDVDAGVIHDLLREEIVRIDDQLLDLGVELDDSTVALPAETE